MAENNMLGMTPIFAPPERTVTTTLPTNSSTRKVRDKFTIGAEKQMDQAGQAQIEAADNQIERENKIAETEAELAREEAERIQAAQVLREQQEQDRVKQLEALKIEERRQQDAVDKAAKPTGYWEEMSTPRRIIAALAIGMGSSVGGNAYEIYKDAAERDRQKKLGILEAEKDKLARMGSSREQIEAEIARKVRLIGQQEETNLKLLAKNAEAVKRSLPHAAGKAEAFKAEILKDLADRKVKNANEFASSSTYHSGSQSETIASNSSQSKGPTLPEREASAAAQNTDAALARVQKLIRENPAAWKEYQDAVKAETEGSAAEKSTLGKAARTFGKWAGVTPVAIDQRLTSSEAKAINQGMAQIETAQARILDPVGAINESTTLRARDALNIITATPAEMSKTIDNFRENARRQMNAAGPVAGSYVSGSTTASVPKAKKFSAEDASMAKWALENKGTEDAAKITKMLKAKYGN